MTNRIFAALSAIVVLTASGASAQTAFPVLPYAPTAVETAVGTPAAIGPQIRPDRTLHGSGNATTAHRTERLGQTIASRIGIGPSAASAGQDASTVHATGRRAGSLPASRIGVSPSAAGSVHDASTVHPRG